MATPSILGICDRREAIPLLDSLRSPTHTVRTVYDRDLRSLHVTERGVPAAVILLFSEQVTATMRLCRDLRADPRTAACPILAISGADAHPDVRVALLESGADLCASASDGPRVLAAHLAALLRRSRAFAPPPSARPIRHGPLTIDVAGFQALWDGSAVPVTRTEFAVLHYLARHAGQTLSRADIMRGLGDADATDSERSIDIHIMSLRRKLPDGADLIQTVRGRGYRFAPPEKAARGPGSRSATAATRRAPAPKAAAPALPPPAPTFGRPEVLHRLFHRALTRGCP